jgi:hypothetical protein
MFPQSVQNRTIPQRTGGGKKLAAERYRRLKDFTLAAQFAVALIFLRRGNINPNGGLT